MNASRLAPGPNRALMSRHGCRGARRTVDGTADLELLKQLRLTSSRPAGAFSAVAAASQLDPHLELNRRLAQATPTRAELTACGCNAVLSAARSTQRND